MLRGLLLVVLGFYALERLERSALADPSTGEPDGAPILLLYGPPEVLPPLRSALSDVVRRDGGAFVDLSPVNEAPAVAARQLQQAIAAYQDFNYGRALEHLNAAVTEADARGAQGLSSSELSDIFIYRALIRNSQGDTSAAWNDFIQSALIDPTRHLDAVRFSPSVAAHFERAREQVNASRATQTRVSAGKACSVFIDGRAVSVSLPVPLLPGTHYLRLECPGYKRYVTKLLSFGAVQEITPVLQKVEVPKREKLLEIAMRRGFKHVMWIHAQSDLSIGTTAIFELMRVDGTEVARTSIVLSNPTEDRATAMVAMSRLLDRLAPVVEVLIPIPTKKAKWYRSPWIWTTVGVAITTAVLLPFVLRDDSNSGFDVSLGGAKP